MTDVCIKNITPNRVLEIVYELRRYLEQYNDFNYEYHQSRYDWDTSENHPAMVIFKFRNPADATAFALRYL